MRLAKKLFKALFLLSGASMLYLGVNFLVDLHHYSQLSHEIAAEFENWEIEEVRSNRYIVVATYHFIFDGVVYHKRQRITKPIYPNIYLAQDHLEKWKKSQKWVWFNPKNPHQSALVRFFPFKRGIYFLLAVFAFLYFLWLSSYVRKAHFEN